MLFSFFLFNLIVFLCIFYAYFNNTQDIGNKTNKKEVVICQYYFPND